MSETLKRAAYEYSKLGCNVVLLRDKKPLHEWQKWIEERQTQEQFNGLPWQDSNQFSLICGRKLHRGSRYVY